MSNYTNTKSVIADNIYTNTSNDISPNMVKTAINEVVDTLIAGGYLYAGIAHPNDAAVSPDANVFYIATEAGTYTNKGALQVADGEVAIFKYNGQWSKETTGAATAAQVTELGQEVSRIQSDIHVGDYSPREMTMIDGLSIRSTITTKAGSKLYYIPAKSGKKYKVSWTGTYTSDNVRIAFTSVIPANGVARTDFSAETQSPYQKIKTASADGYLCVSTMDALTFVMAEENTAIGRDVYDLQAAVAGQVQEIADIKETTEELDNSIYGVQRDITEGGEYIEPEMEMTANLIASSDGVFVGNNSFDTYYIRVKKGDVVIATDNYSCYTAMSLIPPAVGVALTHWENVQTIWSDTELEMPEDGYFCISYSREHYETLSLIIENTNTIARRVTLLEGGQGSLPLDEKVIAPSVIYDLFRNNGFNAVNRIYSDGIYKNYNDTNIASLRVDGKASKVIAELYNQATRELTKDAVISAKGYQDKTLSVPVRRGLVTDAQNKSVRIMCIGDSLTIGGYPAIVDYIFKRIGDEYANVAALMVGHFKIDANVEYNGISKSCRGCCEGIGGAGISSFLRHIFMVRPTGATTGRSPICGKTAWDTLGLGTRTRNGIPGQAYENFTASAAQKELIRTTCHGWYDADPTEDVWNYLYNLCELRTFTVDSVEYTLNSTFAATSAAAITAGVKYLCTTNEGNWPTRRLAWYDYDTVQSSNGAYAFNFGKYLDKYKTLADDGVTRLVVGSTAGTLVTNVNNYDVCKPNFVSIIMAQNDVAFYLNPSGVVADVCLMADRIKAYDTTIKVCFGGTRMFGSIAREEYQSEYVTNGVGPYQPYLANFYELLKAETSHGDVLNTYQMQTVVGAHLDYADTFDGNDIMVENTADNWTHSTLKYYLDRAFQVAAWVIYNLQPLTR